MKSRLFIISIALMCFVFCTISFAPSNQKKADCKKFNVTFSLTYNAMTLSEAGQKELQLRELFGDACMIDVKVADDIIWIGTTSGIGYLDITTR